MLTVYEFERLNAMRPITIRLGTEGVDTAALLTRSECWHDPNVRDRVLGWIELHVEGADRAVRYGIERLALVGNRLIILPTVDEMKRSPLEDWLIAERDAKVRHMRELANDLAATSLRGILEEGITHNAHCPQLAAALARAGWVKLEWERGKPGWRVHTVNFERYVPEAEVERVLGFPLPAKRR